MRDRRAATPHSSDEPIVAIAAHWQVVSDAAIQQVVLIPAIEDVIGAQFRNDVDVDERSLRLYL